MRIEREDAPEGELITVANERVNAKVILSSVGAGLYDIEFLGRKMLSSPASIEDYLHGDINYGKTLGPFAGRIEKGLTRIGGKEVHLPCNEDGNCLNSGSLNIADKEFEVAINEDNENGYCDVVFSLKTRKTQQIPAQISYYVVYSFREATPSFVITVKVESSEEARLDIVNSSYFSLGETSLDGLRLSIPAIEVGHYDEHHLLKGLEPVNVLTDFRDGCKIARHIDDPALDIGGVKGYQHAYKLDDLSKPIILESDDVALFMQTTEPGLAIDSLNQGELKERRSAIALMPTRLFGDGLEAPLTKSLWYQSVYSLFDKRYYEKQNDPTLSVAALVRFYFERGLIGEEDMRYYENMILHILKLPEPYAKEDPYLTYCLDFLRTPDIFLSPIKNRLVEIGYEEGEAERELCFILGLLSPSPSSINEEFDAYLEDGAPGLATEYLYELSVNAGYVEKNKVDRNIVFDANFPDGPSLEISINLSKPEKNNKDIAKLVGAKKTGYPACVLCYDNIGFGGSPTHPARGNIRFVPILLDNTDWYLQFSPYGYFKRHCIAFSKEHVPMGMNEHIYRCLFDFVDLFPHYFIGSNADLPIVGGSILNHEHFQGGEAILPLLKAPIKEEVRLNERGVRLYILDFYNTALLIKGKDKEKIIDLAERLRFRWRSYDDPSNDILSHSGDTPHNTTTPVLRKNGEEYSLFLILRNNRCDERYPGGIFHAHPEFAHIKQEGIGLIEASGLFVLPARLQRQSKILEEAVANGVEFNQLKTEHPDLSGFLDMYESLRKGESKESYMGRICREILGNVAVFKKDEKGQKGLKAFLKEVTK